MLRQKKILKNLLFCIFCFLFSCGGGGGGGSSSTSSTSTSITFSEQWQVSDSDSDTYRTSEYNSSTGLDLINAAEAYAVLDKNSKTVAGSGVAIAIIDTGVQTDHAEIATNYDSASSFDIYNSDTDPSDGDDHGTQVASVAAGAKSGGGMHGVAYDSSIVAVKVFDDYGSNSSTGYVASGISYVAAIADVKDIKVINLSLGGDSDDSSLSLKSALLEAKSADILSIIATGNSSASQPKYPAYYAANSSLSGYVLAVGAVDSTSTIASFSNSCGDAKNYCLVAPGVSIYGAGINDSYITMSGTSQATPHVSGAAAVIRAAWPHLTAAQTAQILLQSATDLGDSGVDSVYGHGLLNLYQAVQYQGDDILSYGSSSISLGYKVSQSSFAVDPIFGDALTSRVASKLSDAIFLDSFGRDYKANLASKILKNSNNSQINLTSFANNNISTSSIPLQFGLSGQTRLKINTSSFKNSQAANVYGLQFVTTDKSQDPYNYLTQGFSFTHNLKSFAQKTQFGFSSNVDEVLNLKGANFQQSGFLTQKNFASNPFSQFLSNSGNYKLNRQYNKMFLATDFTENFATTLSYQSSYNSNQMRFGAGKRQNEIADFGIFLKQKENFDLMFLVGQLKEFDNNILNSKSYGAFSSDGSAQTNYAKISSSYKFKNWHFLASLSEGRAQIKGNKFGIFRDFSGVKTRSSSLALVVDRFFGGTLGASYSEPMRVYSGNVSIDIPVARDLVGNLTRYQVNSSLVPLGKQRDFELFFNKSLSRDEKISVNLLRQLQPNNDSSIKDNNLAYFNYSLNY